MKSKNQSLIVAVGLIAFLVVAMIFVGISKNKNNNSNTGEEINNNSGYTEVDVSGDNFDSGDVVINEEANIIRDENGRKINVSSEINKEKLSFDFVELTDISFYCENNESVFIAKVKNKSNVDYMNGLRLSIIFYNDVNEEMATIETCTSSLPAGGESGIKSKTTIDISNARNIDVLVRGESN